MSIVRAPRPESGWYALDKRISEDERLSWAARGLLVYLLGKPDNWRVSVEHLRKQTEAARIRTGRDGVYALLGELQAVGYVRAIQERRGDGTLGAVEYQVNEQPGAPLPAQPDTAQPDTAKPLPAQPYTAETTLTKTESLPKTEGEQERTPRKRAGRVTIPLPEWAPADAWDAWLDMRAKARIPTTERALELALRDLSKFRDQGHDPRAVLEQSVTRGWRGLFAPRKDWGNSHGASSSGRRESTAERVERINREHDERERRQFAG